MSTPPLRPLFLGASPNLLGVFDKDQKTNFDDYAELFSADHYYNRALPYAHNSSSPVQNPDEVFLPMDPLSSSDILFLSLSDLPITAETLDTLPTGFTEWMNTSNSQMSPTTPADYVDNDVVEVNVEQRADNVSGDSSYVGSLMLPNDHPIDTPTWDGTESRDHQFCERLKRMMIEEKINPRVVLAFLRRTAHNSAGIPMPSHRNRKTSPRQDTCSNLAKASPDASGNV
ncbi:hypothetical protein R3P38DRAFT_3257769 [Favolaschia claudopus]|uniref:Uncharacterized protein n=1 Tax=Favolaschia claudopus TaxID=2862362 RepID=A0AAW0D5V3_9AGAR